MKKFLVLTCLFLFLTACGGNSGAQPSPEPTDYSQQDNNETAEAPNQDEDANQEPPRQQVVVFPTGEFEDPFTAFVDPDNLFELTEEQQALFDEYSRDFNFDISVFRGVDPIDVAQVFFECGINGLWEGEYYLYYFEYDPVSKEELYAEFMHDLATQDIRLRRSVANASFPNLNDGTFVDLGDGTGYIEFLSVDQDVLHVYEAMLRLFMRQIDDVWMINQTRFLEVVHDELHVTDDEVYGSDDEADSVEYEAHEADDDIQE